MYFIYALADPRTGIIWYIGITTDMHRRFMQHVGCQGNNLEKNTWIRALRSETLLPALKILESVPTNQQAREREDYWIQWYLGEGMPLTNILQEKGEQQSSMKSSPKTPKKPIMKSVEEEDRKKPELKETQRRLHYWRTRRFFSMDDLAERSGVDKGTIYKIETKGGRPRYETAEKLAKALGITLDELYGDEGQETNSA